MKKFYSERATFEGVIGGKDINDLKKMDFSINDSSNRIKHVNKVLEDCDDYINEYIEKYYKVSTNNELSDDINVFKSIEDLGTYILNSDDIPSESTQEYKIYTDEQLFMKAIKENEADYDNAMIFLMKNNRKNEYLIKPLSIESADYEDERLKECLLEYKKMLDYLKNQLSLARKGEKIEVKNIRLARKMSKSIKDDMILVKEKKLKPIKLKCNGDFTTTFDWSKFDYTNKNHIRAMLYINRNRIAPDDELSLIKYDIDCAIKELRKNKKLDKKDIKIINLIKKDKSYTYEDIGKELNMSKQAVYGRINRITKRIVAYFVEKKY